MRVVRLTGAARYQRYARRRKPRRSKIPRMGALGRRAPPNRYTFATFRYQLTEVQAGGIYNEIISGVPQIRSGHIPVLLNQFPNAASYKRIFNQYKICKVKLEFIPVNTRMRIDEGNALATNMPTFTTCLNRVSETFPVNLDQALSVPYAKQTNAGRKQVQYYTPVTFDQVYRPGLTVSNALNPEFSQWLTTQYDDVPHHGVSWVMSEAGAAWKTQAFEYRVVATIYVAYKGRRVDTSV